MELFSLQFLLFNFFLLLISLLLYLFLFHSNSKSITTTKTGFKLYPFLGCLPEFFKNRHRYLEWTTEVLSLCRTNTTVIRSPGVRGVMTADPLNIEHVLKTKFDNYPKGNHFLEILEDFLGSGIFNSDGETWKHQRKVASYEFNTKSLRNFVMENVFVEIKTRLFAMLENAAKTDTVLDMQQILRSFAFDNICKVVFNVDPGCLDLYDKNTARNPEFVQAFEEAAFLSFHRFMYVFPLLYKIKRFFNSGSEKRLAKPIKIVHEFVNKLIKASTLNAKNEKKDEDLLSRFMTNNHGNISTEFLRDIVISFILAGRDTTSSALTWFFWLLSTRPEVERKIREELEAIRFRKTKKIGEPYDFDDLREMHYLHAAITESMRLYPPVPFDTKECLEDDILPDGTFVGKNWFVTYSSYAMGRLENIWGKDCYEYKPERWIENGICKQESPFKFPIFHAGPRMCLGKEMAYVQMKSIVALVLERFELDLLLEKGKSPEYLLSFTLGMSGGLPVRVKDRFVNKLE